MHLNIIYQDEYLVVIDKPSGLLVHRSMLDKHETEFAVQLVRDQINQHVFPVHRLDRPTSGVLVFALNPDIARLLGEQFSTQQILKRYITITRGHAPELGEIDYALKEQLDKIADKKAKQDKAAQAAFTTFTRLKTFELPFAVSRYPSARYSLLMVEPKTGRKHQIRRHLAHINHPIIGDTTHGDGKHNQFLKQHFDFSGLALSCLTMKFKHPVHQSDLSLHCQPADHITRLLAAWDIDRTSLNTMIKDNEEKQRDE
ncbi:tRNA pseudouridine(65) synthase TruC [Flavobacterium sp. W21_SRS_FM6]|uniref:tRNA pseudouridine(65) synthase TruC n=1 Tax=Flavobacterium sp. W21_SRS_FM6 TaxID=3240268 RepID=UPI003F900695